MGIRSKLGRVAAALGLAGAALAGAVATSSPASAEPFLPIDWDVTATTHIESVGIDNTTTGGSFVGQVDLADFSISGNLNLPPSESKLEVIGIGLADVGFAVAPTGPTAGTVDLATGTVTMTSTFNIRLTHLQPFDINEINLIGNRCVTRTPITLTLSGPVDLVNGSTISGTFTIPPFRDCGLLTPVINLLLPGPGNTITATATP